MAFNRDPSIVDPFDATDFDGEVRRGIEDVFTTNPIALCRLLGDTFDPKIGISGVAKAGKRKLADSLNNAVNNVILNLANQLQWTQTFELEVGCYTANFTLNINEGKRFIDLMEGGNLITPDGVDLQKVKGIMSNISPDNMVNEVKRTVSKEKIKALVDNTKESIFSIKQDVVKATKTFSPSGIKNLHKMISVQGLCQAAVTNSIDSRMSYATAKYLNSKFPQLNTEELKFLTRIISKC